MKRKMSALNATRNVLRLAVAVLCLAPSACVVGPKYQPPVTANPAAPNYKESPLNFSDTNGWKVAQPKDAMLRGNWWEVFHEPELNEFERQLNIDNQNIKQAFENYMAARAQIREAHAQYYPTVSVSPGISLSRTSGGGTTSVSGTASSGATVSSGGGFQSSEFSAPLDISWAPDLFGRVRNTVREFQFAAQVSAADLENERLLEQATLAQTYFEIRGQDALQQVLDETVKADESVLEVTQGLYDTGLDNQVSLEQAKQTLESARATATNAHIARAQYEHAIATLLGKNATDFKVPVRPLVTAPPAIPVGTPSELLERRPDVAAAERQMAEANALIGIGKAAFYPTLTLSADGGFNNSSFIHWFSWPSRFFSIGPSISETVFDAGLRRATLDQYVATYNADLAGYRQTVLTAFQQVEDYLAETRILSEQIQQAQAATHSAELAFELEKNRYQTGLDPYVTLLTTQTALLATRQSLVGAQIQQMSSVVLLVEALGGGWDKADLPTLKQVSEKPPESERSVQH
jgi:NodT family efflux transporter outer membrane factor (OMF) lipoprotein